MTERGITKKTIILSAILIVVCFLMTGCGRKTVFVGSKTFHETGLQMKYLTLDKEESAEIILSSGDQMQVSISNAAGYVDVIVSQDGEEPIYRGNEQVNADFILTIPKTGCYLISVTGHRAKGEVSLTWIKKRDSDIAARLEEYRTEYIGDAPKVVGIASNIPYPKGYSYRSIEIQSDTEPYGLTVFLSGEGNVRSTDFESAANIVFEYIENMGTVRFCMEETKEELASFYRK